MPSTPSSRNQAMPARLWQFTQADEDLKIVVDDILKTITHAELNNQYTALLDLHKPLRDISNIVSQRCSALVSSPQRDDCLDYIDNDLSASESLDNFVAAAKDAARLLRLIQEQDLDRLLPVAVVAQNEPQWGRKILADIDRVSDTLHSILTTVRRQSSELGTSWPPVFVTKGAIEDAKPEEILTKFWSDDAFSIQNVQLSVNTLRQACSLQEPVSVVAVYDNAMATIAGSWCSKRIAFGSKDEGARVALHDATLRVVEGMSTPSPISSEDLIGTALPSEAIIRWFDSQKALNMIKSSQPDEDSLRICVYGLMNHGKSSFINALIGEALLNSAGGAVTRWPLIIRHSPRATEPVLRISSGHFENFLYQLRQKKFHLLLNEDDSRIGSAPYVDRCLWLRAQSSDLHDSLRKFSTIKNPFGNSPIVGKDHIRATLISINQLLELCKELFDGEPAADNPGMADSQWPVLEVAFDFSGKDVPSFELVDLPGLHEYYASNTTLPNDVHEHAIKGCHAAIFVVHGNFLQSFQAQFATQTLKPVDSEPPLSVFATHSDEAGDPKTIISEAHRAAYKLRRDLGRAHRCAPGLYVSAREGYRFAEEWKEKRAASGQAVRKQDKPPFEKMWAYQPAITAHQRILGEEKGAPDMYQDFEYDDWLKELTRIFRHKHPFSDAVDHFLSKVLQDGKDRRRLRALEGAKQQLSHLLFAQGGLLSQAHTSFTTFEEAKERFRAFQLQASDRLKEWIKSHSVFEAESTKRLEDRLEEIEEQAKKEVVNVIDQVAEELLDNYTHSSHSLYFRTRESLITFLEAVGKSLKITLSRFQQDLVIKVKSEANDAWRFCLMSLGDHLCSVDHKLAPYLADQLNLALTDRADAMEQTIYDMIRRELVEESGTSTPDNQAVEEAMAKSWIPHQQAQALQTNRVVHATKREALFANAVNTFGFMFRPYVSGARLAPHVVTESNVAALTRMFPATIPVENIADIHRRHVVASWMRVLRRECTDTLEGTIKSSSKIGLETVKFHLDRWIEQYGGEVGKVPRALSHEQLEDLVRARAQGVVAHNIMTTVCEEWERILGSEILHWRAVQ